MPKAGRNGKMPPSAVTMIRFVVRSACFVSCATAVLLADAYRAPVRRGDSWWNTVAAVAAAPGEPGKQWEDGEREDPGDEPWDEDYVNLRKLTNEEIQRIRFKELRAFRLETDQPDRLTVRIPRKVVQDFLLEMEGHPDFRGDASRRAFYRLTPPQKLHFIAKYKGEMFMDRVDIRTDPEVFLVFRRQVMPIVLRGCATAGCHSPTFDDEAFFGLFKDPKRLAETTYANFIILNDLAVNGEAVINRAQPQNSLLLSYMLPHEEVKMDLRHPGDVEYLPVYQSRRAPGYRRIERWIASLRVPAPDYGVHLVPPSGRAPPPGDDASTSDAPDSPTDDAGGKEFRD